MSYSIRDIVFIFRPWFWLPGISSALAGYLWADKGSIVTGTVMIIVILMGPGICAFAEIINDLSDVKVDRLGTRKSCWGLPMSGGSGVLVDGNINKIYLAKCFSVIACVIGGIACTLLPARVTLFVFFGYFIAWIYSVPPIRGKTRKALGVFLQGLGYGPIAFYIGYSAVMAPVIDIGLAISIIIGFWIALVGITADLLDYEDDSKNGVQNFVVMMGPRKTRLLAVLGGTTCIALGASMRYLYMGGGGFYIFLLVIILFCSYAFQTFKTGFNEISPRIHLIAVVLETLLPIALTVR